MQARLPNKLILGTGKTLVRRFGRAAGINGSSLWRGALFYTDLPRDNWMCAFRLPKVDC